jgi:hypothetical protein
MGDPKTAGPSTPLRSGRDDNFNDGGITKQLLSVRTQRLKLSSRPERSGVEGPAVWASPDANPSKLRRIARRRLQSLTEHANPVAKTTSSRNARRARRGPHRKVFRGH